MKILAPILVAIILCAGCRTGTGTDSPADKIRGSEDPWISLHDGKTLAGWTVKCRSQDADKNYWKVEDETICADVPKGSRHDYIWLVTDDEYDDFELRLKVQTFTARQGNSGIQVRSRYDSRAEWLDGPQVDINPPGPWRNGFLYDETREVRKWISPIVGSPDMAKPEHAPEGWKWSHADEADLWNDVYVVCRGVTIRTTVNGVPVVVYDGTGHLNDEAHQARNVGMKGHICLQIHPGGQLRIRFKDIRLRKLHQVPRVKA